MSKDLIFIEKVEQYLMLSKRKSLRKKKTRLYCLLFMYVSLRGEQVSLVRPDECFSP